MKRFRFGLIGILVLIVITAMALLSGCGLGNTDKGKSEAPKTKIVTDLVGNQVTIKDNVERIAVVPIPWATIVYAVDESGKKIIGMHPSTKKAYEKSILKDMAPEMEYANTTFVDNNFNINYEELAKLKPDVVIIWDYQQDVAKKLAEMGIPAVQIKYGTLENVQKGIELVGKILNKEEKANKIIEYHKKSTAYFDSKKEKLQSVNREKVLYLYDGTLKVAAKGAVNSIMIDLAGGINAAQEIEGGWKPVTMEQVMQWNPDIIVISNFSDVKPEALYSNSLQGQDWSSIKAVQNKRVYKAPMGIYRWDAPCVETPLMIRWLGRVMHPEVFADFTMEKELKSFYKDYFNYDLDDKGVQRILNTTLNPALDV